MTPACQAARDLLLECRGVLPLHDASLASHVDSCPACSEYAGQVARVSGLFAALPRAPSPRELDGRVVSALQAGYRQDRAVAALSALGRLAVPRELSGRALEEGEKDLAGDRPASRLGSRRAPAVLDRLVDEDLRDFSAAMTRRFAGRLERRRAPLSLRERLEHTASALRLPRGVRRLPFSAASLRLAAAAAFLLLVGGGLWYRLRGPRADLSETEFEVRYVSDLDALDPMARSLLGGLSGGLVDAGGKVRR